MSPWAVPLKVWLNQQQQPDLNIVRNPRKPHLYLLSQNFEWSLVLCTVTGAPASGDACSSLRAHDAHCSSVKEGMGKNQKQRPVQRPLNNSEEDLSDSRDSKS